MEATCNHCNHWIQDQKVVEVQSNQFGLCDELSGKPAMNPEFVLPVVHEMGMMPSQPKPFEMVTGAQFGCNHFEGRRNWIE
ncbi:MULTISPECIES: hypothetical protein [Rufibacter]|uniref:Uncharacterized protein n=1 Tax=Rufibacter quisquiliarum TaxID=1549639 RepID=A0A839GNV0_9BACT|nr:MULTISPECIES: hypothetical protein [Rufibacter]MBA9077215.1 hypothetical protein [Rufibacter quisquiliarum]